MARSTRIRTRTWTGPEGLELEMVLVPAGRFTMGSDAGGLDEQPAHVRSIDAFWIARHPVSRAAWLTFERARGIERGWLARLLAGAAPETNVSWDDATAFCEWAGLALPTEEQWERAFRGSGGPRAHSSGAGERAVIGLAGGALAPGLMPAAAMLVDGRRVGASPFGLADPLLREWCADPYDARAYRAYLLGDRSPRADAEMRVARGGPGESWLTRRTALAPWSRWDDLCFRPVAPA